MNKIIFWLGIVITLVVAGCSHASNGTTYFATVEKVETPEGVYFTTNEGSAPLNYLNLRIHDAGKPGERVLRVHILDRFDPRKYGEPGDVVSFRRAGMLANNDTLLFEELSSYKIVSRAKAVK